MRFKLLFVVVALPALVSICRAEGDVARPNVLFIVADDLRTDLGCYGHADVHSPNIDRLAARGIVFDRAYCQTALCNPSRTSFLTGLRPDTTRVYDNGAKFRAAVPEAVTLPQFFKSQNYEVQAVGKIFHPKCDDEASWSAVPHDPKAPLYGPAGETLAAERAAKAASSGKRVKVQDTLGPPWEASEAGDDELVDGKTAALAVQTLGRLKDRPFFLAVGFHRPHLPFVAPKKYWDMYDAAKIQTAGNPFFPKQMPKAAEHHWSELRAYIGMPAEGPLTDEQARAAIHGYRAATSYLDAQVGRVLDELERLDLSRKTIVVFLGDHGWQLGEHAHWCKHTNFDIALRAPLIIALPDGAGAGKKAAGLVEFVDVYPSLVELCGFAVPKSLDGLSFVPLLHEPQQAWKQAAFSQYLRKVAELGMVMGRSVRNDRYRYTEWTVPDNDYIARELYDYQTDPHGNENIADVAASAAVVREMSALLHGPKNGLLQRRTEKSSPTESKS